MAQRGKDVEQRALAGGRVVAWLRPGADEVLLYVGKAKSLRARVRQYFQANRTDTRPGIDRLVERVDSIETIVTGSEVEALHLEQNLVKRHRPPFNVRLRDDKSFPYIAVTVGGSARAIVWLAHLEVPAGGIDSGPSSR